MNCFSCSAEKILMLIFLLNRDLSLNANDYFRVQNNVEKTFHAKKIHVILRVTLHIYNLQKFILFILTRSVDQSIEEPCLSEKKTLVPANSEIEGSL